MVPDAPLVSFSRVSVYTLNTTVYPHFLHPPPRPFQSFFDHGQGSLICVLFHFVHCLCPIIFVPFLFHHGFNSLIGFFLQWPCLPECPFPCFPFLTVFLHFTLSFHLGFLVVDVCTVAFFASARVFFSKDDWAFANGSNQRTLTRDPETRNPIEWWRGFQYRPQLPGTGQLWCCSGRCS